MNVVFEEQGPIAPSYKSSKSGIVGWMTRNHIVATASRAQTVLLVLVVIILATSVLIGRSALSKDEIDPHKNFVPAMVI